MALRTSLPPVAALPSDLATGGSKYTVLHMGAGAPTKLWPMRKWAELAEQLVRDGRRLIFTGVGSQERAAIDKIIASLPGCMNLCGILDWHEFVSVVQSASCLVGVDSVAVHVAAAVDTPCIVIGNGITNPYHWRPLNPSAPC